MNKDRRERLAVIVELLESLIEEEQAAYDNLPENFQCGMQGAGMEAALQCLNEAKDSLEAASP